LTVWDRVRSWFSGPASSPNPSPPNDTLGEASLSTAQAQIIKPINRMEAQRDAAPPDFDLAEVDRIFEIDSYARQAIFQHTSMMYKQGWTFTSYNTAALDYIKVRMAAIAELTNIPNEQLFMEISEDLVKYHNAFVLKARDGSIKWPKGIKVKGIYGREPVVGYFVADPTRMQVKRDRTGLVTGWEMESEDKPLKLKPEDVIHIPFQRRRSGVFGHPSLLTAREDLRALRLLEDLVLRMTYRNIYPFLHHKVGSKEAPGTDSEIESAAALIERVNTEMGLVTSERHEINAVALDQVIDASPFLKYFESRAFTALGTPETLMGRGQGASRATSESMHTEFVDRVKAYQRVQEAFTDHSMMRELLLEGGFDPMLNEEDMVRFDFLEIDTDSLIKKQNQAVYLYEHNAATEDEMRADLGRQPVTERGKLHLQLVKIPTANAKALPANTNDTDNKVKPKNQHKQSVPRAGGVVQSDIIKALRSLHELHPDLDDLDVVAEALAIAEGDEKAEAD
jgi:hypothetical protein